MQLTCSTSVCPDLLLPQALDFVKLIIPKSAYQLPFSQVSKMGT